MKYTKLAITSLSLALLLHPSKGHTLDVIDKLFVLENENDKIKRELEEREQTVQELEEYNIKLRDELSLLQYEIESEKKKLKNDAERNLTTLSNLEKQREELETERKLIEKERNENTQNSVTQKESFREREYAFNEREAKLETLSKDLKKEQEALAARMQEIEVKKDAFETLSKQQKAEQQELAARMKEIEVKEIELQDLESYQEKLVAKSLELSEHNLAVLRKMHRGFTSFMTVPECKESLQQNTFFAYDPLPISNWLVNANVDSFTHYRTRSILENDEVYQNSYEVWLEPFAQHSNWKEGDLSCDFNAYGFTLGSGVVVKDNYEIGLGFGYWRLDLAGDKNHDRFDSDTDTFIFGPYFSWFFAQEGYFSTMLWGGFNDYHVERKGEFCGINQVGERDHHGWLIAARSEIGYTFYGENFFLKPFLVFNYLSDYQDEYSEKTTSAIGWEESLKVESRHSNFLGTKLALECGTEITKRGVRFLIPKLTLGWLYYHPLSQGNSDVTYFSPPQSKLGSFSIDHTDYSSDNLVFAEGEATFLHLNGFSTSFSFGASVGSIYKNYTGAIRLERVW